MKTETWNWKLWFLQRSELESKIKTELNIEKARKWKTLKHIRFKCGHSFGESSCMVSFDFVCFVQRSVEWFSVLFRSVTIGFRVLIFIFKIDHFVALKTLRINFCVNRKSAFRLLNVQCKISILFISIEWMLYHSGFAWCRKFLKLLRTSNEMHQRAAYYNIQKSVACSMKQTLSMDIDVQFQWNCDEWNEKKINWSGWWNECAPAGCSTYFSLFKIVFIE